MPFIPHTEEDLEAMLATIGVASTDELFDEIPKDLLIDGLDGVPEAISEMEVTRLMRSRAAKDGTPLCFIGAGAYEHHIPAAVWEITTRGEFYSAYTPYQAEASQGTLQTIYEYQSMIAGLTGLSVSNASLYDGASALAEAALMAVRGNRRSKSRRVLLSAGVNPTYRQVAEAIAGTQGLSFDRLPVDETTGTTDLQALAAIDSPPVAVVIQTPSFFGTLEPVDELTAWAHEQGALVIAVANPTALAILKAPGDWGEAGADIACGEGQPLGVPLVVRRTVLWLHGVSGQARSADARADRRTNHRPGWADRLRPDASSPRAAHSALESDLQHLYESGPDGHRRYYLSIALGRRGPGAGRLDLAPTHGAAGGATDRNRRRYANVCGSAFPRGGAGARSSGRAGLGEPRGARHSGWPRLVDTLF